MSPNSADLVILIPSFNEWAALELLLERLDRVEFPAGCRVSAAIVGDASTLAPPEGRPGVAGKGLASLEIPHPRCNLGRQRAIAIGLYHVHEFTNAAAPIVMDGDREDRVEDPDSAGLLASAGNRLRLATAAIGWVR